MSRQLGVAVHLTLVHLALLQLARPASSFVAVPRRTASWAQPARGACAAPARCTVRATAAAAPPVDVLGDGGVMKRQFAAGQGDTLVDGSVAIVRFRGVFGADKAVFGASDDLRTVVGDGSMIAGWDAALRTMRLGERAQFELAPEYGYGPAGVAPVIPPNAPLTVEVEVLDLKGNILTDATFADSSPLTPRDPKTIKEAFERRTMEREPSKGGLEGLLDWAKGIYIFGFFEPTSGGELPWYLRPLITFPAMFAIVGVLFYAVLATSSITMEQPQLDLEKDLLSALIEHATTLKA